MGKNKNMKHSFSAKIIKCKKKKPKQMRLQKDQQIATKSLSDVHELPGGHVQIPQSDKISFVLVYRIHKNLIYICKVVI